MVATQSAKLYILDFYLEHGCDQAARLGFRAEQIAIARGSDIVTCGDCIKAEIALSGQVAA